MNKNKFNDMKFFKKAGLDPSFKVDLSETPSQKQ